MGDDGHRRCGSASSGLIVAPLGLLTGSWLAERYARRGYDDANLRVLQIATLAIIPTSVAFPLVASPEAVAGAVGG